MSIKITTIIENEKMKDSTLENEFGLSLYIEDEEVKLLLDTGKTGLFLKNAEKLNIDLKDLKHLVLSHSHFDHTGGVKSLIEKVTQDFNLYINPNFFNEKYKTVDNVETFIGNDFDKKYLIDKNINIIELKNDTFKLSKRITLFTNFKSVTSFEPANSRYILKDNDTNIVDPMEDEVVIGIDTSKGYLIVCGCSHIGIANIVEKIKKETNKKIYGIVGGLHLSMANEERINKTIEYIKENDIQFLGTSHCTGNNFINELKKQNLNYISNNTGNKLIFD
ncbi:MBL fold metallo-hydrolase [Fusobacterium sp. MFO224]|uniref:MBL fold metallo-hydrolase n=1 Tax=Fusobacterium sp. MFO224 TaxID=3378070 RepID=UPI0038531DBA